MYLGGRMKLALLLSLFVTACASSESSGYRVNSFSPKAGPSCPGDLVAVCDMHMGKPLLCDCVARGSIVEAEEYDYDQ